jgi:holo-[acyl-carrier protein] synthase
MIIGIGIDIVDVARIDALLKKYGERFQQRVFTRDEIAYCCGKGNPSLHFSARFAAKEAAVKALGTGFSKGIRFTDIEIGHAGAALQVLFHNRARELADILGVSAVHASISHERLMAAAVVILEAGT